MKKITLILMVIALMLNLVSCNDKRVETVDSVVTKKYDLDELRGFFNNRKNNECFVVDSYQLASYNDVNQCFPIEFTRYQEGYSVYSVEQGGYYYVFWSKTNTYTSEQEIAKDNPGVYFTAYITSSNKKSKFKSLKPGVSTAEDVKLIDPSVEISFLFSSGVYSFSYLNDESVLKIKYIEKGEADNYCDLIIDEISVIPRDIASSSSKYCTIRTEDLPK